MTRTVISGIEHVECTICSRINRFVVEVNIRGERRYAHINNTGRLREYMVKGQRGYCIRINGKKLKYRLFAVADKGYAAVIDTNMQEKSFKTMIDKGMIPWLRGCRIVRGNPRLNSETLDFMLECDKQPFIVELKSAVLRYKGKYAAYPDCPTIRGRRQISLLINVAKQDIIKTSIVFIAALPHVVGFKPYREGDPIIADLLREAVEAGVIVKSINIYYDQKKRSIILDNPDLPVIID